MIFMFLIFMFVRWPLYVHAAGRMKEARELSTAATINQLCLSLARSVSHSRRRCWDLRFNSYCPVVMVGRGEMGLKYILNQPVPHLPYGVIMALPSLRKNGLAPGKEEVGI